MKKLLAICSIFLTVCATFTACGSEKNSDKSDREKSSVTDDRRDMDKDKDSAGDRVDDVIDGAGEAGDDIIEGATDAVGDVIDGISGDDDDRDRDDRNDRDDKSEKKTDSKRKR